jgi:hypothetical protein
MKIEYLSTLAVKDLRASGWRSRIGYTLADFASTPRGRKSPLKATNQLNADLSSARATIVTRHGPRNWTDDLAVVVSSENVERLK